MPIDGGPSADVRPARYTGFDAIRIVAAMAVVLTHSFELTGHGAERPITSIGHFHLAPGALGVSIFFITSGYLVAQSWDRTRRIGPFVRNRFARIWPALVTLIALTVFVLGPLVTTVSTRAYFTDPLTRKYFVKNCVLVLGFAARLPGVFDGQPAGAVNGSLWTLPQEIYAYAILLACGLVGLLRQRWGGLVMFVAFIGFWRFGHYIGHGPRGVGFDLGVLNVRVSLALGAWFFAGVALVRLPLRGVRSAAIGAVLLICAYGFAEPLLLFIGLPMVVVAAGTSAPTMLRGLHRLGDPSYGIYIYSFPLQQLLYRYGIATTPGPMFVVSGVIAFMLGIASWRLLERPSLRAIKDRPWRRVRRRVES